MSKHESRRAAFEAKCGTRSIDRYSNGSYVDPFVSGAWGGWNAAQDEAEKLRAEVEALRKDAERYRWLRTNAYGSMGYGELEDLFSHNDPIIDEEIDNYIRKEHGND